MGLVRFGTGLMKNPHPDKKFFTFLKKFLNGQAKDLSLSGSTESVCSQSWAVCLGFFHKIFRRRACGSRKPKSGRNQDAVATAPFDARLKTGQTAISQRMSGENS